MKCEISKSCAFHSPIDQLKFYTHEKQMENQAPMNYGIIGDFHGIKFRISKFRISKIEIVKYP